MYDGLDTVVLYDELALDDVLPCAWQPLASPLPSATLARYQDSNLRILQACMALDESTAMDKGEESAQAAEATRLEVKVNLLLDMVSRLLAQNAPRPTPVRVRFNARGATWVPPNNSHLQVGAGIFEIYLHDSVGDPLRMPGRIERVSVQQIETRFDPQPDAVCNLIDKFIFRRHRRRIADARTPKRS